MSAKSKPSLAKGSSGYYATNGGQILGTASDTQASSAIGIGVAHQKRLQQQLGRPTNSGTRVINQSGMFEQKHLGGQ